MGGSMGLSNGSTLGMVRLRAAPELGDCVVSNLKGIDDLDWDTEDIVAHRVTAPRQTPATSREVSVVASPEIHVYATSSPAQSSQPTPLQGDRQTLQLPSPA